MAGIAVNHVYKRYFDVKGEPFDALKDVSLFWEQGENLAIIGESGSGKSTLARLLIGLEPLTGGEIEIEGEDIRTWDFHRWRKTRQQVQAVFQDTSGTMDRMYSVYHNVEEALRNLTDLSQGARKARIVELMEMTGMESTLLKVPVRQLSGGEQRRLSLLRALSIHPAYLIMDEVTSGLDLLSADAVMSLLENYHRCHGCSYLLITHDRQAAYRIADTIYEMEQGRIVRTGTRQKQMMKRGKQT